MKFRGLFIIFLILSLSVSPAFASGAFHTPNIPNINFEDYFSNIHDKVVKKENVLDFLNVVLDTPIINDTVIGLLGPDTALVYSYVKNLTGTESGTALITTQYLKYYLTGNHNDSGVVSDSYNCLIGLLKQGYTAQNISLGFPNSFIGQRIGYLNNYLRIWSKLTQDQKDNFYTNTAEKISDAYEMQCQADLLETMYINGYMYAGDGFGGYEAYYAAMQNIISLSSSVTVDDILRFNNASEEYAHDMFRAHKEFIQLSDEERANDLAIIMKFCNNSTSYSEMEKTITGLKNKYNDYLELLSDSEHSYKTNGLSLGLGGGAMFLVGVGLVLLGLTTIVPTGGATTGVVGAGVGCIIGGGTLALLSIPSNIEMTRLSKLVKKFKDQKDTINSIYDNVLKNFNGTNSTYDPYS